MCEGSIPLLELRDVGVIESVGNMIDENEGGDECDLVTALSHLPVAIEGFGRTDCRKCTSHLLRWPHGAGTLFREAPVTPTMLKTYGPARGRPLGLE